MEAEVEHADALLQREKVVMLNHEGYVKLPNALRSELEAIGRIHYAETHSG